MREVNEVTPQITTLAVTAVRNCQAVVNMSLKGVSQVNVLSGADKYERIRVTRSLRHK